MTVPLRGRRLWVPGVVVIGSALAVLVVLNPWLILQSNTPSGGDMGAHVYGPAYLRDTLLPRLQVQGWSHDWFAGFPLYYFYFPLPSLAIVLLDVFLPYGVAFKIVTIVGLLGLPPSVYFLARALRFSSHVAAVTAAGGAVFALMESFNIYGGNVASTLAGEFSYSWSFSLGFVYLALLVRAVRGERHLVPWAAAVFALAALAHILTIIVLIVASALVLLRGDAPRVVIPVWVWAGALTAFWSVPFVARIGFSTDMAWTPLSAWEELFPIEMWLLIPPAVAGAVWAWKRTPLSLPVIAFTLLPLIYYPLPHVLSDLWPEVFGEGRFKLWNGRLLPYWYFGVVFFASIALGGLVVWLSRRVPERIPAWWPRGFVVLAGLVAYGLVADIDDAPRWAEPLVAVVVAAVVAATFVWGRGVDTRAALTGMAGAVLALGALAGVTFVDSWARWNYSGYEGKDRWPEYVAFMDTMDGLPPGRVMWEYNRDLNTFGTPMSLMLIPYWTGPQHPSMEGLFFESSLTVPFHFLNQAEMSLSPSAPVPGLTYRTYDFDRGIPHLRLYGVPYYVAFTEEAKARADEDQRLQHLTDSPPFRIYEVTGGTDLVEVVTHDVAVYRPPDGGESFGDFALDWYDDVTNLDRLVVADGPEDWRRISQLAELGGATPVGAGGEVSDVMLDEQRISFRTTAVGVPHLVKVSYFPNWTAKGAEGPYRATPSLMVVVPTQEEVVIEFGRTWAEWLGIGLTVVAVGALVWAVVKGRHRGRHVSSPAA